MNTFYFNRTSVWPVEAKKPHVTIDNLYSLVFTCQVVLGSKKELWRKIPDCSLEQLMLFVVKINELTDPAQVVPSENVFVFIDW